MTLEESSRYFQIIFKDPQAGLLRGIDLGMTLEEVKHLEGDPMLEGSTDLAFSTYDFFLEPEKDIRYEVTYYHQDGIIQRIFLTFEYDPHLYSTIPFDVYSGILQELDQLLRRRYGKPTTEKEQKVPPAGIEQMTLWKKKELQIVQVVWTSTLEPTNKLLQLKFMKLPA